ncbi:MAG: rhamnulokinase [Chloroflexota bacterium]|nr:rhamnulokinase [Chloroflexota bacterium]
MKGSLAAVDLGASSGRVMVAEVGPDSLDMVEVHRFPNDPVSSPDGLRWNISGLYRETLAGLRAAARVSPNLLSVGVDSWAVDYALLDLAGQLLEEPYHYRDGRTARGVAAVHALIKKERLYERTGLQFLPFNTIYQLAAAGGTAALAAASTLLLIPDLFGYWLSGVTSAEMTNASTTGLVDARTHRWALDLVGELGIRASILPTLSQPGQILGSLLPALGRETGLAETTVVTHVGSHDTASAVAAVPAESPDFAYVSSGTWSLVGVELERPILTEASRAANFSNELGVDGRIRYLRNVMGLWILQESLRAWQRSGTAEDLDVVLAAAGEEAPGGPVIDVDDPILIAPGDMPERLSELCRRSGGATLRSRSALVRCILDSLAAANARAIRDASRLSGVSPRVVHVIGGGSQNRLLCQLTADACGLPVFAGPVEATAIGNVLVQARAHGIITGDLEALRVLVRRTQPLEVYQPRSIRASRSA